MRFCQSAFPHRESNKARAWEGAQRTKPTLGDPGCQLGTTRVSGKKLALRRRPSLALWARESLGKASLRANEVRQSGSGGNQSDSPSLV